MTDTYEYDAFGNSFTVSGTTPNNYLYRGERRDADLGLYYLRARYYNPQSGRFTGVDPLTDQGQPRYEYAGADPVDGLDPMGTEELVECAILGEHGFCPFLPSIWVPSPPNPLFCDLLNTSPELNAVFGNSFQRQKCKCKKCFNTQKFADYLDDNAALQEADVSRYHPALATGMTKRETYCGRIVGEALRAGGANIANENGGFYGFALLLNNFGMVGYDPDPGVHKQHSGQVGDVTIFGATADHKYGHSEGYTGTSPSGWSSYWQQHYWTPYGSSSSPPGPATIYRSRCPCGQ